MTTTGCLVLCAVLCATNPQQLATSAASLILRDGVVIGYADAATGETMPAGQPAPLTGLRRLQGGDLWADTAQVEQQTIGEGLVVTMTWGEGEAASRLLTRYMPQADGDILVTQQALSATPGLSGMQWGWVAPDDWELLVPGYSGQRLSADTPYDRLDLDYPIGWEAQFVLLQGQRGGVLVFAEDDATCFKALHLQHARGRLLVGLETRCTAPFEPITQASSVRWRIRAYQGSWLVGAGLYRQWAEKAFQLTPLERQQPTWVREIQFVTITDLRDAALLQALARQVNPNQTLLYIPNWRKSGYDYNYPDYTAYDGFDQDLARARELGFRIMLHVNYFGCTPENPDYQRLQPFHTRDPFTHHLLYWEWPQADPPIRFAYINPAARAWRELFVQRMTELCGRYHPDALHLDQTLCIFNDALGPIDGLNTMQGNLALHRELRQALPDVALSGEGLNEITCRYEAFAQRHVYGINHADQEWNDTLIELAHPVSSALLRPYTALYGYLGMASLQPEDYYFAWRKAYERWGVLPTLAGPTRAQLETPTPIVKMALEEARWFQRHRPQPDLTPPWEPATLFAYRTAEGQRAEYRRDPYGVTLATLDPDSRQPREIPYRRITGVTSVALPGSIPGWRAYNERELFGLLPANSYLHVDQPRDLRAFHLHTAPDWVSARRISLQPGLAVLQLGDRTALIAELARFTGAVRCGERLRDGRARQIEGLQFGSETGTSIHPQGNGLFAHPPWHADQVGAAADESVQGLGCAYLEFDLALPDDRPVSFQAGVRLTSLQAAEQSDGVTFRVSAQAQGETATLAVERHATRAVGEPIALDLGPLRGRRIILRLETHPGPAGDVSFDWALWEHPRVVATDARVAQVEVISPQAIRGLLPAADRTWETLTPDCYRLALPVPGLTYLLFEDPYPIAGPTDLSALPFIPSLVFGDRQEGPSFDWLRPQPADSSVHGVARKGLFAHPPPQGQSHLDFVLALPQQPVRLVGFAGIRDGAEGKSHGVGFRVAVNGGVQWSADLQAGDDWVPFEIPLAPYAGQVIVLTLITDSLGDYGWDWAHWGEVKLR